MRRRQSMLVGLALLMVMVARGQKEQRFVILPARAANGIANSGTWQPTKTDLDGLEANLPQIAGLKADGWSSSVHIDHPERYFRQYIPIVRAGKKGIYVNAFCDEQHLSYWRDRLVVVSDGATCYWQALFDPATKKFSTLTINARG